MNTQTKYCLIAAAAAIALAACSDEETVGTGGPVEALVSAEVAGPQTRATGGSEWAGDKIGVMVSPKDGVNDNVDPNMKSLYRNVGYQATTQGPTSGFEKFGDGIFIENKSDEGIVFSAYAPYYDNNGNEAWLPGADADGKIAVDTRIQAGSEGQTAVDYLYAYGATADYSQPEIEFSGDKAFKHQMSRLILKIKAGDGFSDSAGVLEEDGKIILGGLKHDGTFDAVNGGVTVNEGATADSDWTLYDGNNSANTGVSYDYDESSHTLTLTMILIPQILSKALTFCTILPLDDYEQEYKNTSDINPVLAAGYSYTYTVTVNKTGVTVGGCTISAWNDGGSGTASATM